MKAIAGVFTSQHDAEQAARKLRSLSGLENKITLLLPGDNGKGSGKAPVTPTEQSGMGATMGGVVGGATGAAGGLALGTAISAAVPGVGPVIAVGMLGAALLGLAGAGVGAALGEQAENFTTEGLPEDELFVYKDALRNGRSVVIALADDEAAAESARDLLVREGAETVDEAREKWWIGLRAAEEERYTGLGRVFRQDENFYRLGFQAALNPRTGGKEYDQVLSDMQADLEELKRQHPASNVEEPFRHGYERGRAYNESLKKKNTPVS